MVEICASSPYGEYLGPPQHVGDVQVCSKHSLHDCSAKRCIKANTTIMKQLFVSPEVHSWWIVQANLGPNLTDPNEPHPRDLDRLENWMKSEVHDCLDESGETLKDDIRLETDHYIEFNIVSPKMRLSSEADEKSLELHQLDPNLFAEDGQRYLYKSRNPLDNPPNVPARLSSPSQLSSQTTSQFTTLALCEGAASGKGAGWCLGLS